MCVGVVTERGSGASEFVIYRHAHSPKMLYGGGAGGCGEGGVGLGGAGSGGAGGLGDGGLGGEGGGAHVCGTPQPSRMRLAALGRAVELPWRTVFTDSTTLPALQLTVCWPPAWPVSCTPTMPSRLPTKEVLATMEAQPPAPHGPLIARLLSVMSEAPGSGRYCLLLQVKPTVVTYSTPLMLTNPTSSVAT
jgi:hypothetical protein